MVFVQWLTDQEQRHLCLKMNCLDVLQNLHSVWDELPDTLKMFKEHATVQDVLVLFWPQETSSVHCKPGIAYSVLV